MEARKQGYAVQDQEQGGPQEENVGVERSLRSCLPWPDESSAGVPGEYFLLICVGAVVAVIGTPACHGDVLFLVLLPSYLRCPSRGLASL
jgi:hypothetical protein